MLRYLYFSCMINKFNFKFSLLLMNNPRNLSKSQKIEVKRRRLVMLYYFIRTPFYEKYSKYLKN